MIHRHFFAGCIALLSVGQMAHAHEIQTDPQTGHEVSNDWPAIEQAARHRIARRESAVHGVHGDRTTMEYQPSYRNVYTPVTEYSWEPYLANRWNPFSQPTVAYHYVPHTRWDVRTEEQQVPVVRHDVVPEQHTAQVPVVTQHWADVEHITRMAVNSTPGGDPFNSTATASVPTRRHGACNRIRPGKAAHLGRNSLSRDFGLL